MKTKHDYENEFQELMDEALNVLSPDDFDRFKESVETILADYED